MGEVPKPNFMVTYCADYKARDRSFALLARFIDDAIDDDRFWMTGVHLPTPEMPYTWYSVVYGEPDDADIFLMFGLMPDGRYFHKFHDRDVTFFESNDLWSQQLLRQLAIHQIIPT